MSSAVSAELGGNPTSCTGTWSVYGLRWYYVYDYACDVSDMVGQSLPLAVDQSEQTMQCLGRTMLIQRPWEGDR